MEKYFVKYYLYDLDLHKVIERKVKIIETDDPQKIIRDFNGTLDESGLCSLVIDDIHKL